MCRDGGRGNGDSFYLACICLLLRAVTASMNATPLLDQFAALLAAIKEHSALLLTSEATMQARIAAGARTNSELRNLIQRFNETAQNSGLVRRGG